MIALGRELARRGHAVTLQTWRRWQADVEREGMSFAAAPEYHVFPTRERPLTPYQAVERATRETVSLVREVAPAVVISDILTLAPALAGELRGRAGRDGHPPPRPAHAARQRAVLLRRAAAPHAGRPRAVARRRPAAAPRPGDRPPPAQRDAPPARAAGARAGPRRHQRGAGARRDVPAARVPARVAGRHARRRAAHVGAARPRRGAAAGRRSARAVAPSTSQDPGQTLLRACTGRPRRPAGAGARIGQPADPARPGGAAQRPARRLGFLRARDAGLRRSSSATAGTAPSRERWPAAVPSSSCRRRAT